MVIGLSKYKKMLKYGLFYLPGLYSISMSFIQYHSKDQSDMVLPLPFDIHTVLGYNAATEPFYSISAFHR